MIIALKYQNIVNSCNHISFVISSLFLKELRASNTDSGKVHPQSIVSLFESQWSTLQMVILREILMSSIRASDPLSSWSAAARLLRSFYPLITPAGQSGLASSLGNSADRLPAGTRCADPCLPFIRYVQTGCNIQNREIELIIILLLCSFG